MFVFYAFSFDADFPFGFLFFFSQNPNSKRSKTEKKVMKRSTVGTKFPLGILELCKIDPFIPFQLLKQKNRIFILWLDFEREKNSM